MQPCNASPSSHALNIFLICFLNRSMLTSESLFLLFFSFSPLSLAFLPLPLLLSSALFTILLLHLTPYQHWKQVSSVSFSFSFFFITMLISNACHWPADENVIYKSVNSVNALYPPVWIKHDQLLDVKHLLSYSWEILYLHLYHYKNLEPSYTVIVSM